MTEHEKLKEICDLIGYELPSYIKYCEYYDEMGFWKPFHCNNMIYSIRVDVREIIYTTEFMDKFTTFKYPETLKQLNDWAYGTTDEDYFYSSLMMELDDPVSYLYNLLGLGDRN